MAFDQNAPGPFFLLRQIDSDNGVDRLLASERVILPHADPAIAMPVDDAVGIPPLAVGLSRRGRQRLGHRSGIGQPIESAIGEIGKVERTLRYSPRTGAIFMDARARAERLRRELDRAGAFKARANDDIAPLFLRPALQPIDAVTLEANLRKRNRLGDDQVGGDR